jgi:AcrR family transcriptional regulator
MTPRVKSSRRAADRPDESRRDGRSSRWSAHRESRRTALVEAAVAAIDAHGPEAGVAEIAAVAGVSKPVLYRYFEDKAELHAAVGTWGAHLVLARLAPALEAPLPIEQRVRAGVEA